MRCATIRETPSGTYARLIKKFGPKLEFSEEEIGIALDELEEDAFPPDPL